MPKHPETALPFRDSPESEPDAIQEVSTITAKGQTTVPKAVRQALGLACGGRIAFRIQGHRVTVHNPEALQSDPALVAFLDRIEKDIATGRNVADLPRGLAAALRRATKIKVDLDEELEGDVAL